MNIEAIRAKPRGDLTVADRVALVAHGFTLPAGARGVSMPVLSRLAEARSEWQATLVHARAAKGKEPRALARLKRAEQDFNAAHEAALRWVPNPAPPPPRFKRMPKIDPYAVRESYAA